MGGTHPTEPPASLYTYTYTYALGWRGMPRSEAEVGSSRPASSRLGSPSTRSARGARGARLQRADIVEVAVRAADRGELDQLTMRGIADELGVTAMSLYAHIANKDDLLDEVIDLLLAREGLPDAGLDWRNWLVDAAERLRLLLLAQPALLDRYRRRPVGVPAALTRMEAALDVLVRAGFADDVAVEIFAVVHAYTIGFVSLVSSRDSDRWLQRLGPTFDESSPGYWPAFFASLDPSAFPVLNRVHPDLVSFTDGDRFRRGVGAILDGFRPGNAG